VTDTIPQHPRIAAFRDVAVLAPDHAPPQLGNIGLCAPRPLRTAHAWVSNATLLIGVAAAATVALAGCGGDDSGAAPPTPTRTVTATRTHTITPMRTPMVSPTETPTATPEPPQNGFVDEAAFGARAQGYLRYATQQLIPGSVLNALAHMERARQDPSYSVPAAAVSADAWDGIFAKMAALEDTRDFDALYLVNILLGYRNHPLLAPGLVTKVEAALLAFKFWYTDPTPDGLTDDSYYWTENHEAIYYTLEYLMGQTYPDLAMGTDGKSGREHRARAREALLRWFDLRARFGFFEWHSNVYYQKDATPLLTLAEYADDPEIRDRAAGILDLLLFDIAMHTHRGAFGTTHGRSYKKDKMSSLDDDTWGMVKLLFDTAEYAYGSRSDAAALFARARQYRLPEAIYRIARAPESFVDRERMGIAIDELAPYTPHPQAAYEFSYSDPNDLPVWWSMGALNVWQVVPLTIQTLNTYDLWTTTNFKDFGGLRGLAANPAGAQALARTIARMFTFGLLKEVNTATYRTTDYMLSSAQDYRAGSFAWQVHAWQATFDPNALVFTTHPPRPPLQTTDWYADTETGSYWTGEASMPRSAQHENVAIHMYAPQYRRTNPPPFDFFRFEPYTHAYFPQDHFDEVVQDGPWMFGRFRDGYIALYSYRPTQWVVYDPAVYATNGMVKPFDLKADGGADNVWIAECGRRADWGSFDAFRNAVAAATVTVVPRPPQAGYPQGFDVTYESPSQGTITFGWTGPLTVKGTEVPIAGYARHDNPWAQTTFNTRRATIERDGFRVEIDTEHAGRRVSGPS
jgi:hypothetical protein